ncbi:hypothetical protein JDV09_11590 [Mycobacterium sp. Y57]|uniref:hypothetical protein n=1 Tax=Mycolicibacterium xanthum TaxID=2796469 RepID=UPI001C85B22D|nr:hypothetical protein [Mycolicibacterium xanthum]MBX7432741.1 hypothetical protein [Mycolicibacterium xanthum]
MLNAIAIVSSAPVMVPELASSAATETADLREAALSAVAGLPSRWVGIGAAATDSVAGPEAVGTFAGYGVDVRVGLSAEAVESGRPPMPLPLCALIAGWLRGRAQPQARVEMRAVPEDLAVAEALGLGSRLRAELDDAAEPVGVLVVADGANTLTPPAPGGYDPDSVPVQAGLDDALAGGDCDALTRLPAGVVGRAAYQVLAGLAGPAPRSAKELYRGAPYGVGYFVGVWGP